MSWKTISSMGEYTRYKKQDGVNVIAIHEPVADKQEVSDIQSNLFKQFENEAEKNQIRFYRSQDKLSDSGGGVSVFFDGKEVMHKPFVMGSLNPLVQIIQSALEKDAKKYEL